ncbi:unnamed protein product [Brassica rapa subsp. trilocularis]
MLSSFGFRQNQYHQAGGKVHRKHFEVSVEVKSCLYNSTFRSEVNRI